MAGSEEPLRAEIVPNVAVLPTDMEPADAVPPAFTGAIGNIRCRDIADFGAPIAGLRSAALHRQFEQNRKCRARPSPA